MLTINLKRIKVHKSAWRHYAWWIRVIDNHHELVIEILFWILVQLKSDNAFPMGIPHFRFQYWRPHWICTQHPTRSVWWDTKGHSSNPWNKCPKRGLVTMGGQIPIEKNYRSLLYLTSCVSDNCNIFDIMILTTRLSVCLCFFYLKLSDLFE